MKALIKAYMMRKLEESRMDAEKQRAAFENFDSAMSDIAKAQIYEEEEYDSEDNVQGAMVLQYAEDEVVKYLDHIYASKNENDMAHFSCFALLKSGFNHGNGRCFDLAQVSGMPNNADNSPKPSLRDWKLQRWIDVQDVNVTRQGQWSCSSTTARYR